MFSVHLKQILADSALVSRTNGSSMILREGRVMKVEVSGTPSGVTAIDMRKLGSFSPLCQYR